MPDRDWAVLRPYVLLTATVLVLFLLGSFVIDALLPAGTRRAILLTLPSGTGDPVTDYALTIYQAAVLTAGTVAGARVARRRARG